MILERDHYTCQVCTNDCGVLNVHHKEYLPDKKAWEYEEKYLITVCVDCHEFVHYWQNETGEIFFEV